MGSVRGPWQARRRRPRRVFDVGDEPDPRFTLANERTFLAWIRTSLALLAAGIALDLFAHDVSPQLRRIAALALLAAGIGCGITAYLRWMAMERALRLGRALPAPRAAPIVGSVVAAVGVLAVVMVVLGR